MEENIEELKIKLEMQKFEYERIKEERELNAKLQQKKSNLRAQLCEMGTLKKGAFNEFDNYQYFSDSQYKQLINPLLKDNHLEITPSELSVGDSEGTEKQPFGRTSVMQYIITDTETGYGEKVVFSGEGLDRGDKGIYKASTGATKRFIATTFLIPTEDDPERDDKKTGSGKASYNSKNKKGTITPGQKNAIASIYKNDINGLKDLLKATYKATKVDELSMEEASNIIQKGNEVSKHE